jgi:hypothetical protein
MPRSLLAARWVMRWAPQAQAYSQLRSLLPCALQATLAATTSVQAALSLPPQMLSLTLMWRLKPCR